MFFIKIYFFLSRFQVQVGSESGFLRHCPLNMNNSFCVNTYKKQFWPAPDVLLPFYLHWNTKIALCLDFSVLQISCVYSEGKKSLQSFESFVYQTSLAFRFQLVKKIFMQKQFSFPITTKFDLSTTGIKLYRYPLFCVLDPDRMMRMRIPICTTGTGSDTFRGDLFLLTEARLSLKHESYQKVWMIN